MSKMITVPGVGFVEETTTKHITMPGVGFYEQTFSTGGTIITRSLADAVTATDAPARYAHLKRSATDLADIIDGLIQQIISGQIIVSRSLVDNIAASDQLTRSAFATRSLSDVLSIIDSIAAIVYPYGAVIYDRILSDITSASDNAIFIRSLRRYVQDDAFVSDTGERTGYMARELISVILATDEQLRTAIYTHGLSDAVDIYSQILRSALLIRALTATIDIADSSDAQVNPVTIVNEAIAIIMRMATAASIQVSINRDPAMTMSIH